MACWMEYIELMHLLRSSYLTISHQYSPGLSQAYDQYKSVSAIHFLHLILNTSPYHNQKKKKKNHIPAPASTSSFTHYISERARTLNQTEVRVAPKRGASGEFYLGVVCICGGGLPGSSRVTVFRL